eukprot:CAMPEP_0184648008 /NCGR_PEP_ID=MMETSP0308-20130426/5056_1 /TAXON_ID=38269 /ORGANISM="Gloeochaete witrockiana, Strain SAG 46.84" /LENGTH=889 /DNA_ID=CAMNT_0027079487 /DNA_START=464 /DNA_END=3133 /DNA_ORIENTATION=-
MPTDVVNQNDYVELSFYTRKISPLGTPIGAKVVFETTNADYVQSLVADFPATTASGDWVLVKLAFRSLGTYVAGAAAVKFQFAIGPQTFEIGGLQLWNNGKNSASPSPSALPTLPPSSVLVIHPWDQLVNNYTWYGGGATVSTVPVSGFRYPQAIDVVSTVVAVNVYDCAFMTKTTRAVNKGDNLWLSFYARKRSPLGTPIRAVVLFQESTTYVSSLFSTFPNDLGEWKRFDYPFVSLDSYRAGAIDIAIQFGGPVQSFQVSGITLLNFGPTKPNLPFDFYTPKTPRPTPTRTPAPTPSLLPTPPPNSVPIIHKWEQLLNNYTWYGYPGATVSNVPVVGFRHSQAILVNTTLPATLIYDYALNIKTIAPINNGDNLWLSFYARKLAPLDGTAVYGKVILQESSTYITSLRSNFPTDVSEWKRFDYPFIAAGTYRAGGADLVVQFGGPPQAFQLAGISLLNFGARKPTLPYQFYYPGRGDANAPWRVAANRRIDQFRKANFTVVVRRRRDGAPVPGARVAVGQLKHTFKFGTAVDAKSIIGKGTITALDSARYRNTISSLFNCAVFENDNKWDLVESGSFSQNDTLAALSWLQQNNIPTRGHPLIWPGFANLPQRLQSLNAQGLATAILKRINETTTAFKGRLYEWDALNEMYSNVDLIGRPPFNIPAVQVVRGRLAFSTVLTWLRTARQIDPRAKLFVNDFDVLEGIDQVKFAWFVKLMAYFRQTNAAIDGIGLQSHFGSVLPGFINMEQKLNELAKSNYTIAITEFDVAMPDEQLQADFTTDFFTWAFSQPKISEFFVWGFWEGRHYNPNAAYFRKDWSIKPSGAALRDLLKFKWWTRAGGNTNARGEFSGRGFKGLHQVSVVINGVIANTTSFLVDTDRSLVTVYIP